MEGKEVTIYRLAADRDRIDSELRVVRREADKLRSELARMRDRSNSTIRELQETVSALGKQRQTFLDVRAEPAMRRGVTVMRL